MPFKTTLHRFPAAARPNPVSTCRICRSLQREGVRKPAQRRRTENRALARHQIVNAMYTHLMKGWEDLPDASKRALGFDPTVSTDSEEAGFHHFAKLFLDYAEESFRWALAARRRRLGIEGELPVVRDSALEDAISEFESDK